MKLLNHIKTRFQRHRRLKAAIHAIQHDPNPMTRPDAIYDYLSIKLEDVTRKRPLAIGEYEILSARRKPCAIHVGVV